MSCAVPDFVAFLIFAAFSVFTVFAQSEQNVELPNASAAAFFAVNNSRALQIQRLEKLETIKMAAFSFRDFLPSLSFTYGENDVRVKNAPDSRSRAFQVSVTQPIFDGGKKILEYDLGRINAQFKYQEFLQEVRSFESQIILLYAKYAVLGKTTVIQADVLAEASARLALIKREWELGVTLETDYLEYKISCLQIAWEKDRAEREHKKTLRDLKIMLGLEENAHIVIPDFAETPDAYSLLSADAEQLWVLAKQTSIVLQSKTINAEFQRKLLRFDQLRNVPNFSLQASVGFSGQRFPLTEPIFSLKCVISFNNRLFPTTVTTGAQADINGLNGLSSSAEVSVLNSSTAYIERRLSRLSILAAQTDIQESEKKLKAALYETVFRHDDLVHDLYLSAQSVQLMERRLKINKIAVERGEYKHIDYLKDLTKLAEIFVSRAETAAELEIIRRSLEIMLSLPFGGISNELQTAIY